MRTIILLAFGLLVSCQNPSGNPKLASAPYPMDLHVTESVSIQVIRDGEHIEIINSTATDYENTTLWVNQRFSGLLPPMPAGSTIRFNLWSLRDSYGEQFNAGGVWRTDEPTLLIIAELQLGEETSLVGLVVIGEE
jgi:hypothetical protein|tara:strand:- start:3787 stop:4194 length:408 start_codon:yes stop_codon:yes gene_type:complete